MLPCSDKKVMKQDGGSGEIKKVTEGATPTADFQELREWPEVHGSTGRKPF